VGTFEYLDVVMCAKLLGECAMEGAMAWDTAEKGELPMPLLIEDVEQERAAFVRGGAE
jgi:hypothetical protein